MQSFWSTTTGVAGTDGTKSPSPLLIHTNTFCMTWRPERSFTITCSESVAGSWAHTASPPVVIGTLFGGVPLKRTTPLTDPVVAGSTIVGVLSGGFSSFFEHPPQVV